MVYLCQQIRHVPIDPRRHSSGWRIEHRDVYDNNGTVHYTEWS